MKKWFPALAFLFCSLHAGAQLGITLASSNSYAPKWQFLVERNVTERNVRFLEYGVTGVVDYHLPLGKKAWSLRPAVHGFRSTFGYGAFQFDVYSIGIQSNINFAPLSVGGGEPKKFNFFVQFSPGLELVRQRLERRVYEQEVVIRREKFKGKTLAPNFGLNLVLEVKLTDFLTFSPQAGIRYFPNIIWHDLTKNVTEGQLESGFDRTDWRHLTIGGRFGLNLHGAGKR